jgi:hypothetical protein
MKHYLLPLTVAVLLTACGGGGGQGGGQATDANAAANTASNAFFAAILNIVSSTSETDPPVSADSVASGSSETLDPTSL